MCVPKFGRILGSIPYCCSQRWTNRCRRTVDLPCPARPERTKIRSEGERSSLQEGFNDASMNPTRERKHVVLSFFCICFPNASVQNRGRVERERTLIIEQLRRIFNQRLNILNTEQNYPTTSLWRSRQTTFAQEKVS